MNRRQWALAALLSLPALPALADIPEIVACADQPDPKVRLACYDAGVAKLKAELADAQKRRTTLFGLGIPFTGSGDDGEAEKTPEPVLGPHDVNQVDAKLASWTKDIGGHMILTLDNGQVWKVEDSRPVPVSAGKDTVIAIVRNGFGGFYMSVNGHDNKLSVTRLR